MQPVSRRILVKVDHMYYGADMKQSDIAKKLGIEQGSITSVWQECWSYTER